MDSYQKTPLPIRVFLISDHCIMQWGLQHLIKQQEPAMQVVGSATTCINIDDLLVSASADVILVDMDLGAMQVLDAIPRFLVKTSAKILAISRMNDQSLNEQIILAGASGIADSKASIDVLLAAIVKVKDGQLWLDRATTNRVFIKLSRNHVSQVDPYQGRIASLTSCERKVIAHLADSAGASGKKIAARLNIAESTLRNHLSSIYGKLDVANRHGLIAYAQQHGLTQLTS